MEGLKYMKKFLSLVCVLIILVGTISCSNPKDEADYAATYLEADENLLPDPQEPTYTPEPAETASARLTVSNHVDSLTVYNIEISCAEGQQPGGILIPYLGESTRSSFGLTAVDWEPDVRSPVISFAYDMGSSSGRAVFVPGGTFIEGSFPEYSYFSVRFSERDWLYAQVSSNLLRGIESSTFRYFPEISQWLPAQGMQRLWAQERQRLFVAQVEPDLLRELDLGEE